jgi:N utilization substance protein A
MKSDFLIAVTQLAAERHLPREAVISAIEAALASAYKKDSLLAGQEVSVSFNPANGEIRLFTNKTVVDKVEDDQKEITLVEAKGVDSTVSLSDTIAVELSIEKTGRIAAQTAKQVVLQRLREAERELVYEEYADKEGDVVTATVQRADSFQVTLDLGRTDAIMLPADQVMTERYRPGQKLKVFLSEVRRSSRGPEILVSRTNKDLLKRLFEIEVPEINNGIVEIRAVAREAGSRSKVAVHSRQDGVDPVGSCVGLRGIRIQNIVNELQGEKIDVVQWHQDPEVFLANALSPCPVTRVELGQGNTVATVVVPDNQLSLAIGKEGQNARLCAKLSGLRVSIKSVAEAEEERLQKATEPGLLEEDTIDELDIDGAVTIASEATTPEEDIDTQVVEVGLGISSESEQHQPHPVLSVEEQLAQDTLEIEQTVENAAEADVSTQSEEVVWAVPAQTQPQEGQKVRFAEDILGPRGGERKDGGRKKRQTRSEEESRPTKRSRRSDYQEDQGDEDDLEDMVS